MPRQPHSCGALVLMGLLCPSGTAARRGALGSVTAAVPQPCAAPALLSLHTQHGGKASLCQGKPVFLSQVSGLIRVFEGSHQPSVCAWGAAPLGEAGLEGPGGLVVLPYLRSE